MKQLNIGIIGAGRIGKLHAQSITYAVPAARVYGITDVRTDGLPELKEKFGIEKIYASIDDMLADDQIDAVLVCSSTDTHADIAIQAAKAGKHIFCEKPVDLTPEKVEAVLKAVEQAGVNCRWASTAALTTTLRACASWSIRRRSVNWSLSRSPPATRSRHPRNTRRARAACSSI